MPLQYQPLSEALQTGIHLASRSLTLIGSVGDSMIQATYLAKQLLDKEGEDVNVLLSTVGGPMVDGLAIYDLLQSFCSRVVITATGCCYSMGVVVLQAGDVRRCTANAHFLLHDGNQSLAEQPLENLIREATAGRALSWHVDRILADRMGITLKQYQNRFLRPTYVFAQEALALGLVDLVIS